MAGSSSAAPTPPIRAQNTDRRQPLGQRHRHRADGVAEQAEYVGPLAAEEPDLAADQDERGRHQRLERDRGLNTADRGVRISHHRGDRHVHGEGATTSTNIAIASRSASRRLPARSLPTPAAASPITRHPSPLGRRLFDTPGTQVRPGLDFIVTERRCPGYGANATAPPTPTSAAALPVVPRVVLLMTRTVRGTAGVGVTADLVR